MTTPDRDTIAEGIEADAIAGVQSVTVDGQSVNAIPLKERMEAAEWVKKQTATTRNHCGLIFRQFEPGGCG